MNDYPTNNLKDREGKKEKNVEKIVAGPVKTKKRSGLQKFSENIIAEDLHKVKEYTFNEVLIPAVKKAISEVIVNGIDILLYGESGHSKRTTAAGKVSYRNYNDISRDRRYGSTSNAVTRSTYSFDEVIVSTRGEAEAVIMQMDEIIATYGFVKVADLYDLVGIRGSYTDNNYGWTDIRNVEIVRVREGYLIKMPRALPID